jgi:hypothetical protein
LSVDRAALDTLSIAGRLAPPNLSHEVDHRAVNQATAEVFFRIVYAVAGSEMTLAAMIPKSESSLAMGIPRVSAIS